MNRHAQSSIHSLETFIRNDAMLIAGTVEHSNDDHLYFGCNPDGLCSLRAARIATFNFFHRNEQSARDVDIKNMAEREAFTAELLDRYDEIRDTLATEDCKFVAQVIQRLSTGITDTIVDGEGDVRWPDENLLCKWINSDVSWSYVSQSQLFGDGIRGTSFKASQG
jgi:hypothetical protein